MCKPDPGDIGCKSLKPSPWGLFQTIKWLMQKANIIGMCSIMEPRWLVHVNSLIQLINQMAFLTSNWWMGHMCEVARLRTIRMVAGLMVRLNVSSQSIPGHWIFPLTIMRALYCLRVSTTFYLFLNNHIDHTILAQVGLGIRTQVLLAIKAWYSSCMEMVHLGSWRAWVWDLGIRHSVVVWRFRREVDLKILVCAQVTMGWVGGVRDGLS